MREDRVVVRNGEKVRIADAELMSLLEVAFKTATHAALKDLAVEDASTVDDIGCSAGFGNEFVTAHVRLKDGREASVSAPIWPQTSLAN